MKTENLKVTHAIVYNGVIKLESNKRTIVMKYESVVIERIEDEELGVKYMIRVYRKAPSTSVTFTADTVDYAFLP